MGFEGKDGKSGVKIIKASELINFLDEPNPYGLGDMESELCFEITEAHQKVGDVIMLSKCLIKKPKKGSDLKKWT